MAELVLPLPVPAVAYPCADDTPMAETIAQYDALTYAVSVLRQHLQVDRATHLVTGDYFLYYAEGDPRQVVAPDVVVALGVTLQKDESYKIWDVGKPPDLVMEIASPSTRRADQETKYALYERLGITEYWQYDPHGGLLEPRLQGWRLRADRYVALPARFDREWQALVIHSPLLDTAWGFLVGVDELRLWDPADQGWRLTDLEAERDRQAKAAQVRREADRADRATDRANREADRANQAEAEIRRLRAQLGRST